MRSLMKLHAAAFVAVTVALAGWAVAQDGNPTSLDPLMGNYRQVGGPEAPAGAVSAEVVALGGDEYRAVLHLPGDKRVELAGKVADGQAMLNGEADGQVWTGRLAGGRLAAWPRGAEAEPYVLERYVRENPRAGAKPPPDAIVLLPFEPGQAPSLEAWTNPRWKVLPDGSMEIAQGTGDNRTKESFGDAQLHIEFMTPFEPAGRGQGRGNSGVYLHDRYEVQVLDSFGLKPGGGECGAIYNTASPRVNASLPPGQWQAYDITFRAPRMRDGQVAEPARMTVVLNGVTIHEDQVVPKPTGGGEGDIVERGPIKLQDHGHPVRFRNVWLVPRLAETRPAAPVERLVPEEKVRRMQEAAPKQATVRPARPRRVLVYTNSSAFQHSSIPLAAEMVRVLGEQTGAYETVISNDPAMFEADSLARFDAIVMDNNTGNALRPRNFDALAPAQKEQAARNEQRYQENLLAFVRGGKGIVGIHAATDCYYDWAEYGEMMGGYFAGHPWNETVGIKLDEPDHPLNAAFGGEGFQIADEIYQFKEPYSRERLRILTSLDTQRTDMTKNGIGRQDGDFAVSWIRQYGQGRVFYCSLGHRDEVFYHPAVLRHYLDGIQFAIGDLKADATPSAAASGAGWRDLTDGDFDAFTLKDGSWVYEDGAVARKGGGDLWTRDPFGDFVLDLEFRVAQGTNSGVFIRTGNRDDMVQTGIEVQILDSFGRQPGRHECGAIYDVLAPTKTADRPTGEWNRMTITARGPRIEVAMNGERIIDMDLDAYTQPGRNLDGTPNKFTAAYRDMPRRGYIAFQDHGAPVWYRNVRIRPLEE